MTNLRATMLTAARRLMVPALAAATVVACVDLDESARTFISPDQFYRTDAQAAQAVNGVYAPLMGWNGWKSPAQYGLMCDDNELLCWNWMSGGFSGTQAGQWYMQDNSVYMGNYQIIERANQVLAYVPASSGVSAAMKDVASGQALFARGYAYFDLVRRYGGVPLRTNPYVPNAILGAQARATPDSIWRQAAKDLKAAAELLPVQYTQPNGQALPRKASAYGLLAKVYLHMAGHETDTVTALRDATTKAAYLDSARKAAQLVMNDPSVMLEPAYADLFDIDKQNTSKEILWAIQGASVNNSGSQVPGYFGPRGDCTVIGGCGQGFLSLREDFVRTFEPQDKRIEPQKMLAMSWELTTSPLGKLRVIHRDSINKLWAAGVMVDDKQFRWESWTEGCGAFQHRYDSLFTKNPTTGAANPPQVVAVALPYYTLKYIDPKHLTTDQAAANNFAILRYADVLLVFAEAENRLNPNSGTAIAALNQVRTRANKRLFPSAGDTIPTYVQTSTAYAAANAKPINALEWAIWMERQHELHAEFQARFDLVRTGRYLAEMNRTSTVADFSGHGVCKPRQPYQLLQNIPNRELAANPLMTQNSGY
jgi:starch-binding outer membrane protein, SusD/RagB family